MTTTTTAMGPHDEDESNNSEQQQQDFKALLNRAERSSASSFTSTKPFNIDHLTKEKLDLSPGRNKKEDNGNGNGGLSNNPTLAHFQHMTMLFCERLSAYVSMLCYFYPCACGTLVFLLIGGILFGLGTLIFNPTVQYGVMVHHDHSFLESVYNAKAGDIDHWCLRGDNNSCKCEDPLQPTSRADRKSWRLAFKTNRKMVKVLADKEDLDLDVLFVGESVIEEMDGRWMGQGRSPTLQTMSTMFRQRFDKSQETAHLNGAALGVAGDTAPNVLWRLLHGELVEQVTPKIYWLSLGMNDLARMQCSEEVVVLGVLRVVEEILRQKPKARVVINSLFPMSEMRGSLYPSRTDYQDSFRNNNSNNKMRNKGVSDARLQVPPRAIPPAPTARGDGGGNRRRVLQQQAVHTYRQHDRFLRKKKKNKNKSEPAAPLTEEQAADAEDARYEAQAKKKKKKQGGLASLFGFGGRKKNNNNNNPVLLREKHKIHKHIRESSLPIWTSVLVINRELRKFCQEEDRVSFFDVTPLFTGNADGGGKTLRTDLISIRGHPTVQGFALWEDAIVREVDGIIKNMKATNPELFEPKPSAVGGGGDNGDNDDDNDDNHDDDGGFLNDFDNMPDDDDFEDDAFVAQVDDWPLVPDNERGSGGDGDN